MTVPAPKRYMRMWHKKSDTWCHVWDVEEAAYRNWIKNEGPLSSKYVKLPNGSSPSPGTQVRCGTCNDTKIHPASMKREPITLP